jgi:hypothetical protein
MQIPIPQTGPRGSPPTDLRQGSSAIIIATATLISADACTGRPLTVMEKFSIIGVPGPLTNSNLYQRIEEAWNPSALPINTGERSTAF